MAGLTAIIPGAPGALRHRPVWLEAVMIAFLPCLPLFDFSQILNHNDWYNHTWMIAYNGVYFREHFRFPDTINTFQFIGFPVHIFYGFGFFPVLGVLCTLFNPQVAVLVGAYALFCLQYSTVALALIRMNLPRWFAASAAAIVTFAVYPLTNLYNRNAIPEFFAGAELNIAMASLLLSFASSERRQQQCWFLVAVIAYGLMAATHPITLRISAEFLVLFCLLLLLLNRELRNTMLLRMAALPLIMLPWLSPWLYAYFSAGRHLHINKPGLQTMPDDIDSFSMRFSPILFERRFWHEPFGTIKQISTPFLDAPVNNFLLGLALVVLVYSLRHYTGRGLLVLFAAVMALCWGIFVWCSLSSEPYGVIVPQAYAICQFLYRMVNMVNLAALAMLLGMAFWLKSRGYTPAFGQGAKMAVLVLVTVAAYSFLQKMVHASSVLRPHEQDILLTQEDVKLIARVPNSFYSQNNFVSKEFYRDKTPKRLPIADTTVAFAVGAKSFGAVEPVTFNAPANGWYSTNIYAFIWNRIKVDGEFAPVQLFPYHSIHLNVHLKEGPHTLEYVFDAPPLWYVLRGVSIATGVILLLLLNMVLSRSIREAKARKRPQCP